MTCASPARDENMSILTSRRLKRPRPAAIPAHFSALWLALWLGAGCSRTSDAPSPAVGSEAPIEAEALERWSRAATAVEGGPVEVAEGAHGAVSSAELAASQVGIAVLRRGGNAVDAAVAVGFALGVTHPSAGNIGGGGFMLVRFPDGRSTALDYREVAPLRAHRDMYQSADGKPTTDSEFGPRAAGIPGVVAGLALAHRKYGTLPWADLVMPAVQLAREGVRLDAHHAEELSDVCASIALDRRDVPQEKTALLAATSSTLAIFQKPDHTPYRSGDLFRQPELAASLERIALEGPAAFYRGSLAREMVAKVTAMGGIWSESDLAEYRALERAPIAFSYRGHDIVAMPPPSAGGIILAQILTASEQLGLYAMPWDSIPRMHLYVEVLRRAFADRNRLIADPAFVSVPVAELMTRNYVSKRMADIDRSRATPSDHIEAGVPRDEPAHTTHFSIVDEAGTAVANTYTLNGDFGARVQIPGTGVTLNNEMDDFTAQVGAPNQFGLIQGEQNAIQPRKRMLSSMSPTIIAKQGKLRAIVGSPGGPTIISTVAQVVMQLVDTERSLDEAVRAPRLHHQWFPDQVWYEPSVSSELVSGLRALGHGVGSDGPIGHANCIEVDPRTGVVRAVADVFRYGGSAAAY